jgi:hypothetical protein
MPSLREAAEEFDEAAEPSNAKDSTSSPKSANIE